MKNMFLKICLVSDITKILILDDGNTYLEAKKVPVVDPPLRTGIWKFDTNPHKK